MAKMFPYPVEKFKNETEKYMYHLFREKIGSDYFIFYGRSWIERLHTGNPDPECDFIITKPNSGILIVEVKGGKWERKNGDWCCYGNEIHNSDDPLEQAKSNKYSLLRLLKTRKKWGNTYFPISYALALPDTSFTKDDDFIGLPKILTYDELDYIDSWLEDAMSDCLISNYPAKTDSAMIDHLLQTLMKDYVIHLSDILRVDDHKLLIFTQQQLNLDRSFYKLHRLTIQGCAGSGKTLMAIRQAKRLSKKPEVKKILFTCFNLELGKWLSKNAEDINDKCLTMPIVEFFEHYALQEGVISNKYLTTSEYYDFLPYAFLQANENLQLKFDAIVVDEGQSFKKDWWDILETLLVDQKKSYFYIFFDDLQRIYQEDMNSVPREDESIDLIYNLRNTANIHRQATKFLPKDRLPFCSNIIGEPVSICFYENIDSMLTYIRKILTQLIQFERISSKDIIILTPKSSSSFFKTSDFEEKHKIGPYKIVSIESEDPSSIRFMTIQKFRGMERQIVILVELDSDVHAIESLFYLGCSRAKTKLFLLASKDIDDKLRKNISKGCEDITNKIL